MELAVGWWRATPRPRGVTGLEPEPEAAPATPPVPPLPLEETAVIGLAEVRDDRPEASRSMEGDLDLETGLLSNLKDSTFLLSGEKWPN